MTDFGETAIPSSERSGNGRPAPRGRAAYPRRRAVKACQTCRARRTKCDNAKPSCSFCLKVGAQCVQSSVDLSSFDPASLRILERLDELEEVVKATANQEEPAVSAAGDYVNVSIAVDEEKGNLSPGTVEEVLQWPCFQGLLGTQPYQKNLLSMLRSPTAASTSSTVGSSPASIAYELEPRTMNTLLDNFFQYCHVKNPILTNEPAVRRMAVELCLHGVDWSAQSCLILLVCALGTISTSFESSGSASLGDARFLRSLSYFQHAQKRLGSLMDTAGVIEAQCMFLAGVYSMCIFRISSAWRYFSQALACCQEFEFITNDAPEWSDTEAFETQQNPPQLSTAEQVMYWSSWKSERENRKELKLHDFEWLSEKKLLYPSFFPTPPQILPGSEADELQVERQSKSWYFYLTEISLHRLAARTAAELMNVRPLQGTSLIETLIGNVSDREGEIEQWVRSLAPIVSLDTAYDEDDVAKFVIRGHLINLYELLYWPFLVTYLEALESNGSKSISNKVAVAARHRELAELALFKHVERLQRNRPGFYHRHHGTWFMIRTCTRSALVLLRAALVVHQQSGPSPSRSNLTLPNDWQQAVLGAIELNRHWAEEAVDAQERLPQLERLWHRVCAP